MPTTREIFVSNYKKLLTRTLEVVFEGEVGTGIGPTLEFYNCVSNQLRDQDIWVPKIASLHPLPDWKANTAKSQEMFLLIGRFVGKSFADQRLINLKLSLPFLKKLCGEKLSFSNLSYLDEKAFAPFNDREVIVFLHCYYPGNYTGLLSETFFRSLARHHQNKIKKNCTWHTHLISIV